MNGSPLKRDSERILPGTELSLVLRPTPLAATCLENEFRRMRRGQRRAQKAAAATMKRKERKA